MHRRLVVSVALFSSALGGLACGALGCGGSAASSEGGTTIADATPVGNAAVTARIASVPSPPVAWSTQFGALTHEQAATLCPWVQTHIQTTEVNQGCPDGTTVRIGAGCEADGFFEMAQQMGQVQCSITLAEEMACILAMRADPCGAGTFGANAPECEAMTACIRAAFAAAQPTSDTPPDSDASAAP